MHVQLPHILSTLFVLLELPTAVHSANTLLTNANTPSSHGQRQKATGPTTIFDYPPPGAEIIFRRDATAANPNMGGNSNATEACMLKECASSEAMFRACERSAAEKLGNATESVGDEEDAVSLLEKEIYRCECRNGKEYFDQWMVCIDCIYKQDQTELNVTEAREDFTRVCTELGIEINLESRATSNTRGGKLWASAVAVGIVVLAMAVGN